MLLALLALCAATLALTGCKTDSEDDLPDWGNPDGGDQPAATGQVVLNEICGKQNPDDDWVELYNTGSEPIDLSGASLIKTDGDGLDETLYTFTPGYVVAGGDYAVIATLSGELQAGIYNSKEVGIRLQLIDGTVLDRFDRDSDVGKNQSHATGGSYARVPNGTGAWTIVTTYTRGLKNQ